MGRPLDLSVRPAILRKRLVGEWYKTASSESPGIVYLVEDLDAPGLFKIGHTRQLRQRIVLLSQGRRIRFVWYIITNQMVWLERFYMGTWAANHVAGEWFRLALAQVDGFRFARIVNWKGIRPVADGGQDYTRFGSIGGRRTVPRLVVEVGQPVVYEPWPRSKG